jgi:hypothetical protein
MKIRVHQTKPKQNNETLTPLMSKFQKRQTLVFIIRIRVTQQHISIHDNSIELSLNSSWSQSYEIGSNVKLANVVYPLSDIRRYEPSF